MIPVKLTVYVRHWPLLLSALLLAAPAAADTLRMPERGVQAPLDLELPARALTMQQVRERFGEPQGRKPPVGDPPITRWVYPRFTVYFEHQYVVHAVLTD